MRLIDADELMEHVYRDRLDSRELIAKMIEKAPTVKEIPVKIPIDIWEKLLQSSGNCESPEEPKHDFYDGICRCPSLYRMYEHTREKTNAKK